MVLGQNNQLEILRFTAPGAYLGDTEGNEVLLPGKYINHNWQIGEFIEVFIYKDSEDRFVATTEIPLIFLGEFKFLKVKEVTPIGAFLDWGLEKDLLVPFKEQQMKMIEGKRYMVTLQLDHATHRLFASSKINKYLVPCVDMDILHQEVNLVVSDATDLGIKVIVNNAYHGLVFKNNINQKLFKGQIIKGFIEQIRVDGKLDICLEKIGFEKFDDATLCILNLLEKNGVLPYSDKSDPDEIREYFKMSKKTFKQAIGKLYKERRINILENAIEIIV
jgi:predicted RNA-binding protein (virulence factor B family)